MLRLNNALLSCAHNFRLQEIKLQKFFSVLIGSHSPLTFLQPKVAQTCMIGQLFCLTAYFSFSTCTQCSCKL